MEQITRKPLQGIKNIIRFNRHFYVLALLLIAVMFFLLKLLPPSLKPVIIIILFLAVVGIVLSLSVSWYIYDHSDLYSLNWLDKIQINSYQQLVIINAGFDETSTVIHEKYVGCNLVVLDFYDPAKHTEISIERARKAYPAYPGTKTISTTAVPLNANSVDCIFLIFAAHEIRNQKERIDFFHQLGNSLKLNGKIILTEHQRDINNFIAYNIGFFHFFSTRTWKKTISIAGLRIESTFKLTPFITTFVLTKNGITA